MPTAGPNPWTTDGWTMSDLKQNGDGGCHFAADESEYLANNKTINHDDNDESTEDGDEVEFHDMQIFCHAINEPQLIEKFLHHKVTLGQLLEFDEQDLINCGIDLVGDRKKVLSHTAQMHCEKWMPSSLNDLTAKSLLSSPGIYVALNDVNRHLEYIGVTFRYLRRTIQKSPEILELGKDYVGISKVSSEIDDLIKTTKSTYTHLQALDHQVSKHLDNPILKPANHIDPDYAFKGKLKQILMPTIIGSVIVVISIKSLLVLNRLMR